MANPCFACGGDLNEDAGECPHCGIRILREDDGGAGPESDSPTPASRRPDGFDILPSGFAAPHPIRDVPADDSEDAPEPVPVISPTASSEEEESEAPGSFLPIRWTTCAAVLAIILLLALAAFLTRKLSYDAARAPSEPDVIGELESRFRSFLASPALKYPAVDPPRDLDALAAEIQKEYPEAFAKAAAAHRVLTLQAGQSLHDVFEAYLARLIAIDPDWASALGIHPHPEQVTSSDVETTVRLFLLDGDAWRILESWPGARSLSTHDRVDFMLFRSCVERGLHWRDCDADPYGFERMVGWFVGLEQLAAIDCCPAEERRRAAVAHLARLPARIEEVLLALDRPPLGDVMRALERVQDIRAGLKNYTTRWDGDIVAVEAGVRNVLAALERFEARLRGEVLPRSDGTLGIGPAAYDRLLRRSFCLTEGAEDVFRHAVEEFAAARQSLREAERGAPLIWPSVPVRVGDALKGHVASLSRGVIHWVSPGPRNERGIDVREAPPICLDRRIGAFYLSSGPLGQDAPAAIMYNPRSRDDKDPLERSSLVHMAAHETYPGHHLQSLLARESACRLRLACGSSLFIEGWAVYAEDLIHETGDCFCHPSLRAVERMGRAFYAILEVLIHTRAADARQVLEMMRAYSSDPLLDLAAVADVASMPGLSAAYLVGPREIRRLRQEIEKRQGNAFDLQDFHSRLLRRGPVPPALLRDELVAP